MDMKAPGKLVNVNDTKMHVYSNPSSLIQDNSTIVFLAGHGTPCPTYDFKPLWHLLTGNYNIVIVERPGYGWSGQTNCPRDIDTILEETREALKQAGITSPFIPAAHSLSGLEAIYWAQKYPEEISAIIGLDMAIPQFYESMELPRFFGLQSKLIRLLRGPVAKSIVKNHPAVKNNLLDEKEQSAMRYIISKQLLSKNMIDEINYVKENARKVAKGKCSVIPLLCFLSDDKGILKSTPTWGKAHREYFETNDLAQFIQLHCDHYVHSEAPQEIADAISGL